MSLKESEFDKYLAIFENEKRYISDQFAFLNGYLHEDYLNDRLSLTFAIKTIENEDIIGAIKVLKGEDEVDYSKYSYNLKVYIKPENRNKGYASEALIALFRAIKANKIKRYYIVNPLNLDNIPYSEVIETLNIKYLLGRCSKKNKGSEKVLLNAGFTYNGKIYGYESDPYNDEDGSALAYYLVL